ncbi:uncharacterized protein LOC119384167 [Rhipicephalus sanguineus]|uniref:uncharacterized protein LOC119384167 n=1 Tax=Rhipicephalus sanguineus TaxID=34632 RepID=UPI0020C36673|nr:uncharacterized protein LOC119384167 [Rhipicephalus sanguineus]
MADEGQTPRYSSTCSGSNQVVQETNQASSTQDNASEDPQIRPGATPEAERPLLTTSACSSDTAQTGTSSAAILQESAGSEKVWADMLKDRYEKTIGNPQSAHRPGKSAEASNQPQGNPADDKAWVYSFCMKGFTCAANPEKPKYRNLTDGRHQWPACVPSTSRAGMQTAVSTGNNAR